MTRDQIYFEVYDDMEKQCKYFVEKSKFITKVLMHPHHQALKKKERYEIKILDGDDILEDKRDILDKISALPHEFITLREINQFFPNAQKQYQEIDEKIQRARAVLIKEKTIKWDLERSQQVEKERKERELKEARQYEEDQQEERQFEDGYDSDPETHLGVGHPRASHRDASNN